MRRNISAGLMLLGLALTGSAVAQQEPPDRPQGVAAADLADLDRAMAPVVAKAMATYPAAKLRFEAGLPRGQVFFVTTRLRDDTGGWEQAFVRVESISQGFLTGTIDSPINQQRTNEPDLLRILAQKPNTMVSFMPAPAAGTCATLAAGQFCEVKIQGDTEIVSTEPILVGQFLESSTWSSKAPGSNNNTYTGTGDPSMAIAVPTEQFRKDYTILVPSQYTQSYVSIAAAATGGVLVDNTMVTLTTFPGCGMHRAARVPLTAGQHKITCADGCGITV